MSTFSSGYSLNASSKGAPSRAANQLAVPSASSMNMPANSRKNSNISHASKTSVDLVDKDEAIADFDGDVPLELETFQAPDFNVGKLVSGLTDSLIAQSKEGGGGEQCYPETSKNLPYTIHPFH